MPIRYPFSLTNPLLCGIIIIVNPEKYVGTLENTNPTLLARFPNLATLERVNLIIDFTIT